MHLRADALAEIKTQFAEPGRWEAIAVNDHVETILDGTRRHITITVQEPATGRMLAFVLEGHGAGEPTHGTLQWGGGSYAFDDGDLIARLMTAVTPAAEDAFNDELMAFLTAAEGG